MLDFNTMTKTQEALLLGLLPLLGASGHFSTAIIAVLIVVCASFAVRLIKNMIPPSYGETAQWSVSLAVSLALSFCLSELLLFLIPYPEQAKLSLYLASLTPLVYFGANKEASWSNVSGLLLRFSPSLLAMAFIRELGGRGTLMGYTVFSEGFIPFGLLSKPAGAFLLVACLFFLSDFWGNRLNASSRSRV